VARGLSQGIGPQSACLSLKPVPMSALHCNPAILPLILQARTPGERQVLSREGLLPQTQPCLEV
jgi:hypothetical protein